MKEDNGKVEMTYEELARYIIDGVSVEELNNNCGFPFVIYILGPPCVGKTFLQKALFSLIGESNICFISAGCFLKPRNIRLRNLIAECSADAYDLLSLRRTYETIIHGTSVYVSTYNHEIGEKNDFQVLLKPKKIIYIEGIAWSYMLDICKPDLIVFLSPQNYEQWILAYQYRNEKYRNYKMSEAKATSILAYNSWKDLKYNLLTLKKPLAHKMIYATVAFHNNYPYYEVYPEFLPR